MDNRALNPISDEVREEVLSHTWYHNIDLGGGLITPGRGWDHLWGPSTAFLERASLAGKKVLEIGTWDGYFSFQAERLGAASVLATDIKSWETFHLAKKTLGSKVEFQIASIYTLREQFEAETFDAVICYGIFYHLLHPVLGFVNANHVLREGGLLFLEGGYYRRDEDRSLMYFSYGDDRLMPHDPTYCVCPTIRCLRNMVEASHFEILDVDPYLQEEGDTGRVLLLGQKRATQEADQLYEDTYPNQLLSPYD